MDWLSILSRQQEEHDRGIAIPQYRTMLQLHQNCWMRSSRGREWDDVPNPVTHRKLRNPGQRWARIGQIPDDGASHIKDPLGYDRSCVAAVRQLTILAGDL